MTRLLIALAVAVAIGSTYPFDFQPRTLDAAALLRYVDACCRTTAAGGIVSNIAAFAILGCLGLASAADSASLLRRTLLVLLAGTVFSLALQLAQFYLPSRHESLEAVGWNVIGILAGAVLGCLLRKPNQKPASQRLGGIKDPTRVSIRPATGMLAVTVNLRESQAVFLDQVAGKLGVDVSQVCRKIIDQMLAERAAGTTQGRSSATAQGGDTTAIPSKDDSQVPGPRETAAGWTRRTLILEPQQVRAVRELAQDDGLSLSHALRRHLAAFLASAIDGAGGAGAPPPRRASRPLPARGIPVARSRSRGRRRQGRRIPLRQWVATIVLGVLASPGIIFSSNRTLVAQGPSVIAAAPWARNNIEVLFDHHSRTKYSDGTLSLPALVDLAYQNGCDALAVTDRSDGKGTASADELADLRLLRRQLSGFLLFGGIEVNMPSYGGREGANIIVDPDSEEKLLPQLRDAAEAGVRRARSLAEKDATDDEFLKLVAGYVEHGDRLLMIYNHPSREDKDKSENYKDMVRWNARKPLFIGFAGAPGHQNAREPGNYRKPFLTIDRWDPVVAEVGGAWDRLLSEGHQLWGAIAGSSYRDPEIDKGPCDFARTHVQASGLNYSAVLDALRAGTFWSDHGKILHRLSFTVEIAGLASPVYPGSIVSLGGEPGLIQASVALERGQGADGIPLEVEFIGNCRRGTTELLSITKLAPDETTATAVIDNPLTGADNESCFLRARVRRQIDDGPDLMAYTNPIRIMLR